MDEAAFSLRSLWRTVLHHGDVGALHGYYALQLRQRGLYLASDAPENMMRSYSSAVSSMNVGNSFFMPTGLHPPWI